MSFLMDHSEGAKRVTDAAMQAWMRFFWRVEEGSWGARRKERRVWVPVRAVVREGREA